MTLAGAFARMSGMSGTDHVTPGRPGVKLTYDDYLLFPDDGKRHELIDGEHYVTPSPSVGHQQISGNLHLAIGTWIEQHPSGKLFYAPLDVIFSNVDIVEPDLLYISNQRAAENGGHTHVRVVPELVIEIASRGTRKRDETIKRHLYERTGVDEYWVIDPDIDVVRVYRRAEGHFARAVELARERHDILTTPLMRGLEVPLERIFRE